MRLLSFVSVAAGGLLAATLAASAADLKAPPAAVAPIVNTWTGCYIGGNIVGQWGSGNISDSFGLISRSGHNSGFAGGGQIGCDFKAGGAWVFGIRDMFDWSNRERTDVINTGAFAGTTVTLKNNWVDLLTGRIGYAVQPQWLLYFQGGAAWRQNSFDVFGPGGFTTASGGGHTRTGWTIGGGSEWKFAPNVSVFLEYDYADFGSRSVTVFAPAAGVADTIAAKSNVQVFWSGSTGDRISFTDRR